jgi:hypothetical protein
LKLDVKKMGRGKIRGRFSRLTERWPVGKEEELKRNKKKGNEPIS